MNRKTLGALVALNAALLLAIAALTLTPSTASAQFGGGAGEYTMIAAKRSGQTSSAVHIFDTKRAVALTVEPNNRGKGEMTVIAYRNITNDFKAGGGR